MKFAFDIHGTIGSFPLIFKPIMSTYVTAGIKVCIISGPPEEQLKNELYDLGYFEGIHYNDGIYSVVDFLKTQTNIEMDQHENGSWYCEDHIWWNSKGLMCDIFNIDLITDNDIRYNANMPSKTTFVHWIV